MSIYSIAWTDEEHEFESAEPPYILMPGPRPSTDHRCHPDGYWFLSSSALANAAAMQYLDATNFYIVNYETDGTPIPQEIIDARAAVQATIG